MSDPANLMHKIIKNSVDYITQLDSENAELKMKYEKLLGFVKDVANSSASMKLFAKQVLKEIGEI